MNSSLKDSYWLVNKEEETLTAECSSSLPLFV